jgi:hypothetical protein
MSRPAKRRRKDGSRAAADRWDRWQFWSLIVRVVIEVLEPLADRWLGGGGPGRLP